MLYKSQIMQCCRVGQIFETAKYYRCKLQSTILCMFYEIKEICFLHLGGKVTAPSMAIPTPPGRYQLNTHADLLNSIIKRIGTRKRYTARLTNSLWARGPI